MPGDEIWVRGEVMNAPGTPTRFRGDAIASGGPPPVRASAMDQLVVAGHALVAAGSAACAVLALLNALR